MRLPVLCGTIERRILVNFRVDADILARLLPPPFRPQLVDGYGMAGICLIRLRGIRPRGWPAALGFSSENAAHRIAVEWDDAGRLQRGVYVPRRDSSSKFNVLVGGRLFPGVHHLSRFDVRETEDKYRVSIHHSDGTRVLVDGRAAACLPAESIFGSLETASQFFAGGSLGYSVTARPGVYDGLELRTREWKFEPFAVEEVASSFFEDRRLFPAGSTTFDSAFLMRDIEHEWHERETLCCAEAARPTAVVSQPRA